jgi:multicomponent Na+:H+ antiporter subunit G
MDAVIQALPLVGKILMVAGGFFLLSSAVGLVRFPTFFTRLHPAGIADSAAAPLMLLGVALQFPLGLVTVKIILLLVISMVAAATACHALAASALLDEKHHGNKKERK